MESVLKAFLVSWNWRLDVLTFLILLGVTYILGWYRLRKRSQRHVQQWSLVLYLLGLLAIAISLLSPIDTFGSFLFVMHMIQHELLVMIAPPLLLLANPFPVFLWAFPQSFRHWIGRLFTRDTLIRRVWWVLTWLPVAWVIHVLTIYSWHIPASYERALHSEFIHDLQHLSFFLTAILFWWPLINPAPRLHGYVPYAFRIGYAVAAIGQNTLLSALIALTDQVLYPYYLSVPRIWSLTALEDQALGAGIMWVFGGMMYMVAVLVLVARLLHSEERELYQHQSVP